MNALGPTPAIQTRLPRSPWPDRAGTLMRWVLGALFVQMGWTKAIHPEMFLKLLRQYDLTSQSLVLNSIAATLPWFEIFCGVLLLTGVAVRGTALLVLMMLVPFTVVVFQRALAVADLQHIAFCAVSFDCGCGNGEVLICRKLVENAALMFLAGCLIAGFGRPLAARYAMAAAPASK